MILYQPIRYIRFWQKATVIDNIYHLFCESLRITIEYDLLKPWFIKGFSIGNSVVRKLGRNRVKTS